MPRAVSSAHLYDLLGKNMVLLDNPTLPVYYANATQRQAYKK